MHNFLYGTSAGFLLPFERISSHEESVWWRRKTTRPNTQEYGRRAAVTLAAEIRLRGPDNHCYAHAPSLRLRSSCDSEPYAGPQALAPAPAPHRHPRGHLSLRRGARVLPLEAASVLPGRQSRCIGTKQPQQAGAIGLPLQNSLFLCLPRCVGCPVGI